MQDRHGREVLQQRLCDPVRSVWWRSEHGKVVWRPGLVSMWRQVARGQMHPYWYGLVTWVDLDGGPLVRTEWVWDAYLKQIDPKVPKVTPAPELE